MMVLRKVAWGWHQLVRPAFFLVVTFTLVLMLSNLQATLEQQLPTASEMASARAEYCASLVIKPDSCLSTEQPTEYGNSARVGYYKSLGGRLEYVMRFGASAPGFLGWAVFFAILSASEWSGRTIVQLRQAHRRMLGRYGPVFGAFILTMVGWTIAGWLLSAFMGSIEPAALHATDLARTFVGMVVTLLLACCTGLVTGAMIRNAAGASVLLIVAFFIATRSELAGHSWSPMSTVANAMVYRVSEGSIADRIWPVLEPDPKPVVGIAIMVVYIGALVVAMAALWRRQVRV